MPFGCSNAIVATLCFFIMDRRICAGSRHLPALFFFLFDYSRPIFVHAAIVESMYLFPRFHSVRLLSEKTFVYLAFSVTINILTDALIVIGFVNAIGGDWPFKSVTLYIFINQLNFK